MPLFEYRCEECGNEFEELVFKENAPVPCPGCDSENTCKLMSSCRFKTGGSDAPRAYVPPTGGRSGCAGCSGGSCATCH